MASSCSCCRLSGHLRFYQHISPWCPRRLLGRLAGRPAGAPGGPAGRTPALQASGVSMLLGAAGGALSGCCPHASDRASSLCGVDWPQSLLPGWSVPCATPPRSRRRGLNLQEGPLGGVWQAAPQVVYVTGRCSGCLRTDPALRGRGHWAGLLSCPVLGSAGQAQVPSGGRTLQLCRPRAPTCSHLSGHVDSTARVQLQSAVSRWTGPAWATCTGVAGAGKAG